MKLRRFGLDSAVNIILVLCCVVVAGLAIERRVISDGVESPLDLYEPGELVDEAVGNSLVEGTDRTLLLFVRSTCPYCTSSMPFYQAGSE